MRRYTIEIEGWARLRTLVSVTAASDREALVRAEVDGLHLPCTSWEMVAVEKTRAGMIVESRDADSVPEASERPTVTMRPPR